MRRASTRARRVTSLTTVALLVAAVAAAGCGGDDATAFVPTPGSDTAYCDAYRAWQVHELDGGEGPDQPNPAALRKYWNEYLIFEETLLHEAPAEIRDERWRAWCGDGERERISCSGGGLCERATSSVLPW